MNKTGMYTYQRLRMGRRPFLYGISIYRERRAAYYNDTTLYENCRKLQFFEGIFNDMKNAGKIGTTDPRHMTYVEIEMFISHMRRKGLSAVTRRSYLKILNSYLKFFDNNVIEEMKEKGRLNTTLKGQSNPVRFLTIDDLQKLFDAASVMEGHGGIIMRGYLAISFGIAGRPKEVIGIHKEDLDLDRKAVFIRDPKGDGSYGKREWVPIIREDMIPLIRSFLEERETHMKMNGINSQYLFYNRKTGNKLALNTVRKHKVSLEKSSGITFQLKDMRSSYATITFSAAPELKDAISRQMRHYSTTTTEKYYIAYTQSMAAEDLREEWKKNPIRLKKYQ